MPSKKWSENDVRVLRNAAATTPASKMGAPWRHIAEMCFPGKFDATQVRNFANRQGITKGGIGAGGTLKKKRESWTSERTTETTAKNLTRLVSRSVSRWQSPMNVRM